MSNVDVRKVPERESLSALWRRQLYIFYTVYMMSVIHVYVYRCIYCTGSGTASPSAATRVPCVMCQCQLLTLTLSVPPLGIPNKRILTLFAPLKCWMSYLGLNPLGRGTALMLFVISFSSVNHQIARLDLL